MLSSALNNVLISISICINISMYYSMIIWNCQKVNSSNSALKPLQRLPNVPKVLYVWEILIFQAPVTYKFTGESHGYYLQLEHIGQHWRNLMEIHTFWLSISSSISFNCLQSQIGLMIFSSWSGGPIFIKYQNIPYYITFGTFGSLGRGFSAELEEFTFDSSRWSYCTKEVWRSVNGLDLPKVVPLA